MGLCLPRQWLQLQQVDQRGLKLTPAEVTSKRGDLQIRSRWPTFELVRELNQKNLCTKFRHCSLTRCRAMLLKRKCDDRTSSQLTVRRTDERHSHSSRVADLRLFKMLRQPNGLRVGRLTAFKPPSLSFTLHFMLLYLCRRLLNGLFQKCYTCIKTKLFNSIMVQSIINHLAS